jgi:hypothetical protein
MILFPPYAPNGNNNELAIYRRLILKKILGFPKKYWDFPTTLKENADEKKDSQLCSQLQH